MSSELNDKMSNNENDISMDSHVLKKQRLDQNVSSDSDDELVFTLQIL